MLTCINSTRRPALHWVGNGYHWTFLDHLFASRLLSRDGNLIFQERGYSSTMLSGI